MLLPVPKFSKFLHGAALLFQHRCLNVPYWFLPGAPPLRRPHLLRPSMCTPSPRPQASKRHILVFRNNWSGGLRG